MRREEQGAHENREKNHALQRLVGVPDGQIKDACDRVEETYACFRQDLETTVKTENGAERYGRLLDELRMLMASGPAEMRKRLLPS